MKRSYSLGALVLAMAAAQALVADEQPVKIGVLADMSSGYSDIGGKGLVEAARMAVEDFGGKVPGQPIELIYADGQNKGLPGSWSSRPT